MDIIQLNKFSNLHDGKDIIFCKTDFLLDEFKNISMLNNNVILISGNSDYSITDDLMSLLPKNVIKWYAQNALSNDERLIPIPIGIENKTPSLREGHGIGYYERVLEKELLLTRNLNVVPYRKIYANFNVNTNYSYRTIIKNICINSPEIVWEESKLSLEEFFNNVLKYECVVCPIGNGIDTHRLWEVLYSNRIPITIKVGNYKIYELYKNLPIIILNNENELLNIGLLNQKIDEIKSKKFNLDILNFEFWKNKIINNI